MSAIVLLAVLPLAAAAQDARGTISGTVVDASKGLVPGASVTATNIAMGTEISAVTNADGFFQIPYLLPGAYKVTVELAGFVALTVRHHPRNNAHSAPPCDPIRAPDVESAEPVWTKLHEADLFPVSAEHGMRRIVQRRVAQ